MGKWRAWIIIIGCLGCVPSPAIEDTANFEAAALRYEESQEQELPVAQRIAGLKRLLETVSQEDTIGGYATYALCRNYYSLRQYDSVQYYGRVLMTAEKTKQNLVNLGKYYHLLGYYHEKSTAKFDSAYYYHDLAKRAYLQCRDTARAFGRIVRLGYLQRFQGDYFGAKETLIQALSLAQGKRDNDSYASLFNELGVVNMELENIPEAQKFYAQAIASTNSSKDRLRYQNNYGVALMGADQHTEAQAVFDRLLRDSLIHKDSAQLARALQNRGHVKWKMEESGALQDLQKAYAISATINDINGLTFSHQRFGQYYGSAAPARAIQHLDTAITLAKTMQRPRLERDALELLLKIAPKNIAYKDRFIRLSDSLYKQELQVKTQFAYLKYQDQQEKEQLLQLEAATARQEAELARKETQTIVFFALGALVVAGGFVLFFLVKQQHKREKLKVVYNTEKRISQELHDGLANDVFGLMTQIQGKKKTDKEVLDHLEGIYQTSRRISHQNAPIQTGAQFAAELGVLVDTYQDDATTLLVKGMTAIDWTIFNDHKCIAVHRAIKELLVNMKKHAGASLVLLQFDMEPNQLVISYRDNGIGLDPNRPQGMGLRSTESRIKAVGGTTIFEVEHEQGTQITFSIPL